MQSFFGVALRCLLLKKGMKLLPFLFFANFLRRQPFLLLLHYNIDVGTFYKIILHNSTSKTTRVCVEQNWGHDFRQDFILQVLYKFTRAIP